MTLRASCAEIHSSHYYPRVESRLDRYSLSDFAIKPLRQFWAGAIVSANTRIHKPVTT